jgi:hypothetical protein
VVKYFDKVDIIKVFLQQYAFKGHMVQSIADAILNNMPQYDLPSFDHYRNDVHISCYWDDAAIDDVYFKVCISKYDPRVVAGLQINVRDKLLRVGYSRKNTHLVRCLLKLYV